MASFACMLTAWCLVATSFKEQIMAQVRSDFAVGPEDKNDVVFVGQCVE